MYSLVLALVLAAAPVGAPSSPARAVAAAYADMITVPPAERPYLRYLWLPMAEKDRADFLVVLGLHLNLLSDQGDLSFPLVVRPDLVRIDIREYGWDRRANVYELLARTDVFFHARLKVLEETRLRLVWPGGIERDGKEYARDYYDTRFKAGQVANIPAPWLPGKEITFLRESLYTEAPVLNAEWFFVQTARQISIRNKEEGAGYYDFLGLKDRKAFFKVIGLDEKEAIRLFQEWRAIVDVSGVSQQNRQVVALRATTGRAWVTLDTFVEKGQGVAKRNLRRGEFAHQAEEWYAFLPNGLFVTFLSDAAGVAIASAPDQIGPDDSPLRVGRDGRIHVGISCFKCHGLDKDFLKPVDDWARKTFRKGGVLRLQDDDKKTLLELRRQYLSDLERLLVRDREDYVDVVRKATATKLKPAGLSAPQITNLYGKAWNRYVESRVSAADAARELGVTEERFLAALKRYQEFTGKLDLVLGSFLDGQSITRLEWEDSYALAATIVLGLLPPEIEKKVKANP